MTWISVVLVIAVGMFLLRDNIAKFINNAALQITGESSNDGLNEYGFYFNKRYTCGDEYYSSSITFYEDGSYKLEYFEDGVLTSEQTYPAGSYAYSNGYVDNGLDSGNFTNDGKTIFGDYHLEE